MITTAVQGKNASRPSLLFTLAFAAALVVGLAFCIAKSGYFVDEIYSYGLSNSYYSPFLKSAYDDDITGKVIERDALLEYVRVDEGQQFTFDSVFYNQSKDVHPPLYYCVVHLVSSFLPGVFSKWIGLAINLVFFGLTLFFLYRLSRELFDDEAAAVMAMLAYGMSQACLSTLVLIRMYMLMSLLTVLLAYVVLRLHRSGKPAWYVALFAVAYCGMLTQYLFAFYLALLAAAYVAYLVLRRRELRRAGVFAAVVVVAGLAMLATFPAVFEQMTNVTNRFAPVEATPSLAYLVVVAFKYLASSCFVMCATSLVLVACVAWRMVRGHVATREALRVDPLAWIIVAPAFAAYFLVRTVWGYHDERYTFSVIPLMAVLVGMLVTWARGLGAFERSRALVPSCCALVALASLGMSVAVMPPNYMMPQDPERTAFAQEHASNPVLYFVSTYRDAAMTNDYEQLVEYGSICTVNADGPYDESLSLVSDYLARYPEGSPVVVYIQTYATSPDPGVMLDWLSSSLGLEVSSLAYESDLSETYVLVSNQGGNQ